MMKTAFAASYRLIACAGAGRTRLEVLPSTWPSSAARRRQLAAAGKK